uniref:uncharacterized protein n=1 Tax=Semicossyphus pulcher TaxID=241346 RepID=UPI0037E91D80
MANVQEDDSGDYRAEVSADHRIHVGEYKVTVQDPVSPVKLTVKHCSTDSSNLTVTCSTLDSLISSTFTCVNQTCSHERGELSEFTTSAASLRVYLENGSVICNHSNQVSWKKDVKRIEDLCKKSDDSTGHGNNNDVTAIVVPFVVLIIIAVAVLLLLYLLHRYKRGKYKTVDTENTIYEDPKINFKTSHDSSLPTCCHCAISQSVENTNQPLNQIPTTSAPVSPTSTYCLVGPHAGTVGSPEARSNTQPESLYATVEKPAKS